MVKYDILSPRGLRDVIYNVEGMPILRYNHYNNGELVFKGFSNFSVSDVKDWQRDINRGFKYVVGHTGEELIVPDDIVGVLKFVSPRDKYNCLDIKYCDIRNGFEEEGIARGLIKKIWEMYGENIGVRYGNNLIEQAYTYCDSSAQRELVDVDEEAW